MTDEAKHGREAAIRGLHAYRSELQTKLVQIQEDILAVDRSIRLLSGAETGSSPPPVTASASGYAELKPQAAVERLLHEHPDRKFKPSVAAKELLRRGCRKSGKQWTAIVACALSRAKGKGIAGKGKANGRNVYYLAPKIQGAEPVVSRGSPGVLG